MVFAADPAQADDLIRRRLRGRRKGLTLVSNDAALLQVAEAHGVETLRGDEFVARFTLRAPESQEAGAEDDVQLSEDEVHEWLALFRSHRAKRPDRTRPGRSRRRK